MTPLHAALHCPGRRHDRELVTNRPPWGYECRSTHDGQLMMTPYGTVVHNKFNGANDLPTDVLINTEIDIGL